MALAGYASSGYSDVTQEIDGFNFAWFDPMNELASAVGTDTPEFQFWCQTCGGTAESGLIDLGSLNSTSPPSYSCFSGQCLSQLGFAGYGISPICILFSEWMYSLWWNRQTGGAENPECTPCGLS